MSEGFYLPSGDSVFIGLASAPGPRGMAVAPRDGTAFGMALSVDPDGRADAGCNDRGVCVISVGVVCKAKPTAAHAPGDRIRSALAGSASAAEARDALLAFAEERGRNQTPGGASSIVAGPDGAFLVESAGDRWAWRQLDGPTAIGGSFSITHDYKRLDAATRKSIAPVNERMACLDEADAGRLGDKDSWKGYMQGGTRSAAARADSRKRALETLLEAAMSSGGMASAFAILRAHGVADPVRPTRGHDFCRHDGLFRSAAGAAVLFAAGTDRSRGDAWATCAPWACANLFKPIVMDGEFTSLWSGIGLEPAAGAGFAYWQARRKSLLACRHDSTAMEGVAAELAESQGELMDLAAAFVAGGLDATAARAKADAIVRIWDGA